LLTYDVQRRCWKYFPSAHRYAPHLQTLFSLHSKTSEGFYTLREPTGSYDLPLSYHVRMSLCKHVSNLTSICL
jgi:hypothetical protein